MTTAFRIFAIGLLLFTIAGCASDDSQQQQTNPNASTIPWNRPQSWEGQGMLGGYGPNEESSTGAAGH